MKGFASGEEPWVLPEGWLWKAIQAVAPVNPKRTFEGLFEEAEIAFVPMAAVAEESGRIDVSQRRSSLAVRKGYTKFRTGDVIFAKITPCMENGKIAIIPEIPTGFGAGSTEFHVLEPQLVEPRYLFHWLAQRSFRQTAEFNMTGTAGQKRVPTDYLRSALIPVPDREQQRRIVARIDELFSELEDGEEELERARADLETYRKALLKAAVTGELTADWRANYRNNETARDLLDEIASTSAGEPTARMRGRKAAELAPIEFDNLPKLPESWAWVTVGQLSRVSGGVTKSAKRSALPISLPYLRVANVGAGKLDLERVESIGLSPGEVARVMLKRGDLLIVEGNGSVDQIGRSAIWGGQIEPCVHQNHLIKARFCDERFARWTQLWLRSPHGRRELEKKASSTSGLHTLSISKVENVRCPLPPSTELSRLLEQTEDALASGGTANHDTEDLAGTSATLRQSILTTAFRGELVQ